MARLSTLLIAVIAVSSAAFAGHRDDDAVIGRYQIALSGEGLYFLDTATGELWLKAGQGNWKQVDSPVIRKHESKGVKPKAVSLTLPKAGETMPMVQREKRAIPGSSDTLWVQLGDITGGQVFVEVIDINGHHLVNRTSLKNNEFVKFKVDQRDVYLQVAEMVNNLLDQDLCQVHLSLKKPKREQRSSESDDSSRE